MNRKLRAVYLVALVGLSLLGLSMATMPAAAAGNVSVGNTAYQYADLNSVPDGSPTVTYSNVSVTAGTNAGNTSHLLVDASPGSTGLIDVDLYYDVNKNGQIDPGTDTKKLTLGNYDRTSRFNITVRTKNFRPYVLVFTGNLSDAQGWSTTYDQSSGNITTTVSVTPVEYDFNNTWQPGDVFDGTYRGDIHDEARVSFSLYNLSTAPPSEKARLNGTTVLTDAQTFSFPQYTPPDEAGGPSLEYDVGAPHFTKSGSVNRGVYEAFLPRGLLASWGGPSVENLTASGSGGTSIDGSEFTEVRRSGNRVGVLVNLSYHYSQGTISVGTAGGGNAGYLAGTVTDDDGPVQGVQVLAVNSSTHSMVSNGMTDGNGNYNISVTKGEYDVAVDQAGYNLKIAPENDVETGETTTVDLTLTAGAGTGYINGTVVDSNGNPVENANVFAAENSYTDFGSATTDASGTFSIEVTAGTYRIRVDHSNYASALRENVTVTENGTTQQSLTVAEPGFVAGTVTAPDAGAPQNAFVVVDTASGVVPGSVDSGTGQYNVTVPPGTHTVSVMARGATSSPKQATVSVGATNTTDFQLLNTSVVAQSVEIVSGPGNAANLGMRSGLQSGFLQLQVVNENTFNNDGLAAPSELEGLGVASDTKLRMNVTVKNFTANSLLWGLDDARWSTSANDTVTNGTDITITGSPATMQVNMDRTELGPLINKDPSEVQWSTGRSDRATDGRNQTVYVGLFDLSSVPPEFRNALSGMSVTTNAQTFSMPAVKNDSLRVWVAAPTKTADGVDHSGFYQAEIPDAQLAKWGVTDPGSELSALYKGSSANFTVTNTSTGARIRIDNISYSAGYVEVEANPSSGGDDDSDGNDGSGGNNAGGGGGGAAPPPTQSATSVDGGTAFSKAVEDENPDAPGTTVSFEPETVDGETRSPPVDAITFDAAVATSEPVAISTSDDEPSPDSVGSDVDDVVRTFEVDAPGSLQDEPATLSFTVARSELGDRDPADVRLARQLDDGSWETYEATPVDADADRIRYEAAVDGFSRWSVVIRGAAAVETTTTTTTTPGPPTTTEPPTTTATDRPTVTVQATAATSAGETETASPGLHGFGPALAVVGLLAAALLAVRRRD